MTAMKIRFDVKGQLEKQIKMYFLKNIHNEKQSKNCKRKLFKLKKMTNIIFCYLQN